MLAFSRIKRRILSNYRATRILVFVGLGLAGLILIAVLVLPLLRVAKDIIFGPISIAQVLIPTTSEIKNTNGRTNVLLLGIGGPNHDGPNLSDTILIASVKTKFDDDNTKIPPVVLISLPRDLYLESLGDKINYAYAKGAGKSRDAGLALSKATVSQVTGLPIHYGVVVDFSAFQQIIDLVGGVDIDVKRQLDDYKYPLPLDQVKDCDGKDEEDPCWYEHLHFDAGMTHMNGETALKFVRSRHALGNEGSDFARSARQQQVISAVKDKFFSTQTFLNPTKIEQLYNLLKAHVYTDADPKQINLFLRLALKYRAGKFKTAVIDDKMLVNPQPIDERGWILLPKDGNFKQIQSYIKKQINAKN